MQTPEEFERLYADRINATDYKFYSRYGLAYDATWAIALGLNTTLARIVNNDTSGCEGVPGSIVPLADFEYDNALMGCLLRQSYHQTSFSGVTVSKMIVIEYLVLYQSMHNYDGHRLMIVFPWTHGFILRWIRGGAEY